jgi:hypothetical protein
MEDKKFANILRTNKNSLYLVFGQSKESNTRILQALAVSEKQSSEPCKNIIYDF